LYFPVLNQTPKPICLDGWQGVYHVALSQAYTVVAQSYQFCAWLKTGKDILIYTFSIFISNFYDKISLLDASAG